MAFSPPSFLRARVRSKRLALGAACAALVATVLAACGGSHADPPTFPAHHLAMPAMINGNGPILKTPHIVTVTFPGDPLQQRLEQFGTFLPTSNWWHAVTAEYGYGTGSGEAVRLLTPSDPAYTESTSGGTSSIAALLQTNIQSGVFPAPTSETLYVLYFPQGVRINMDGNADACTTFAGYHLATTVQAPNAPSMVVPYAVVPRCSDPATNLVTEAYITTNASHEILEAAMNVTPLGTRGWAMPDTSAWGVTLPESGDLCANDDIGTQVAFKTIMTTDQVTEGGFAFQRGWSNASEAANHDPCVPVPAGDVYFNAAPRADAILLGLNESTTIQIDAFSEAPVAPWTLVAFDTGAALGLNKTLKFSFETTLNEESLPVQNGGTVSLTVTLINSPKGTPGQLETLFWIISKGADRGHIWPVVVVQK